MDNEDGLTVTAVWFCDCLDEKPYLLGKPRTVVGLRARQVQNLKIIELFT